MSKLMVGLMAAMVAASVMAQTNIAPTFVGDFNKATALQGQRKWAEAQVAFAKLISDYPTASPITLANARWREGRCFSGQKKWVEMQTANEKVLADYPDALIALRAIAQSDIGGALVWQGKLVEAEIAHAKALTDYPQNPSINSCNYLVAQGRVDLVLTYLFNPVRIGIGFVESLKKSIKDTAVKAVKADMLSKGESFVTGAGQTNKIEGIIAPVVTALNAPLFNGLEKALSDIGIATATADRTAFSTYAAQVKANIESAQTPPASAEIAGTMVLFQGVEAWNTFIETYNGKPK